MKIHRKYTRRELSVKHGIRAICETRMQLARRLGIKISELQETKYCYGLGL